MSVLRVSGRLQSHPYFKHTHVRLSSTCANTVKERSFGTGKQLDRHQQETQCPTYVDNLFLFRCLGLHLGRDIRTIYAHYTDQLAGAFEGITIDDLHRV